MIGEILVGTGLVVLGVGGWIAFRRRRGSQSVTFTPEWETVLLQRFAAYEVMPENLREELKKRVVAFVREKRFEACGSLTEVTEEMKIVVAAQACVLLVGRTRERLYPRLHSILMYPGAFRDAGRRTFSLAFGEDETHEIRLGESWQTGSVILAWDSVLRGAANDDDGLNVVIHEFAHQLDQADGAADGVPKLDSGEDYMDWAPVMQREYAELVDDAERGRDSLLDPYGAENPAEFFAVATETFFEKPKQMRKYHRRLYDELMGYYGIDPAFWD